MSLQHVHHIVIRVKDLEQGIASYEAMGLKLDRRAENTALSLKQAFFKLDEGAYIEVCSPTDPNSAVGKALESRGEGVHSIVFKVADIAQTAADFKGRGVSMIGDTFVHPKSTHGLLVQLTDKA